MLAKNSPKCCAEICKGGFFPGPSSSLSIWWWGGEQLPCLVDIEIFPLIIKGSLSKIEFQYVNKQCSQVETLSSLHENR